MKIQTVHLNKVNLIKIKNIDDTFYNEDILTLDWYLERYNEKHTGILLMDNDLCVGYLVSVPIKKELYDAIVNGVMINDLYINPDMILEESNYNYIVSAVILKEYTHKGYGKLMLEKLFSDTKGYFCALTITQEGYQLVSNHMDLVKRLNNEVCVFTLNI